MLSDVLPRLPVLQRAGPDDAEIGAATGDSRKVRPLSLFAAIPGTRVDGHRFVPMAVTQGASVVVVRDWPSDPPPDDVVVLRVADPRRALALVSSALADDPAGDMQTFGITGTNGKTSTSCILGSILRAASLRTGTLGTTGIDWSGAAGPRSYPATHTTPDGPALYGWLSRMRDEGVEAVALELSSHALEQGRAAGLALVVAAWSYLDRDHLDYHQTMQAYEDAKALLLNEWLATWGKPGCVAVLNIDDEAVARHVDDHPNTLRVSSTVDADADLQPVMPATFGLDGCRARLRSPAGPITLATSLLGPHNLDNALLAAGCALAAGLSVDAIEAGLEAAKGAPGRLERVQRADGRGPLVLVDYAHTPDALTHVLSAIRPLFDGRIVTVFGCGGDRDVGKRRGMGVAVAAGSDRAVLTSDNPRTEDPELILDAVEPGLHVGGVEYTRISDRAEAIAAAIAGAEEGDVVLLAGKGHETFQELADGRIDFDDRVHARAALEARP